MAISDHRSLHDETMVYWLARMASYATFGPVYPTPSKARYGQPVGVDQLARATGKGLPILALGGVGASSFGELAQGGAVGAATIRLFQRVSSELPEILRLAQDSFPTHATRSE